MLLEERQADDLGVGEPGAALGDRVAGLGHEHDVALARGSTRTCANEKIASFDPKVGMISRLGVELDAEAALAPARDRVAQLGQALARAGSPR